MHAEARAAEERRSARRGWSVVAGAFGVMFAGFGCTYCFSAFFTPLQEAFTASRAALSWIFSIAVFLYFVLGAVSGPLADRLGPRGMTLAGVAIIGLGLLVASRAEALWQIYLGYGLGVGIGIGFAYVPAIGAVQRWFVRRRGLASGIAVSGIGVGTLVMPKVAEWLIEALDWRGAFLALGLFSILGGGLAALFIDGSPERHGFLPDGGVAAPNVARAPAHGMTLGETVRSRAFRFLYAACFFISIGLFIPFVHLVPHAQDQGIPYATAVTLFTLVGVGSTVGRFALGGLADRLGRKRSLALMYLGVAVMMGWWFISREAWQIAAFALIYGTFYGGFVALAPALLVDYFGPKNASGIIGFAYTGVAVGTLLGPSLAGYAFDLTGSYAVPIAVSALFSAVAAALVWMAPEPGAAGRAA
ncbi:MAG TPA: MCT family MFS transporter [Beijerinckiaceae bacterium]|nr:MCT family MFS transporter [Beijerinckiaceae bacterium]